MTHRLYFDDSFISEFSAVVTSCERAGDGYTVTLDRSAFFPEGGGQKGDTGFIGAVRVYDTQESGGEVYHYTREPAAVGETVKCAIDWETRFRRMQNHSGEHIVSGIAHSRFGCENVGFHMGADGIIIDFSVYLDRDEVSELELAANRAIYENAAITARFPSDDELKTLEYRSKLELTGNVRIVTVEGYDVCACCAPHLRTTGQVGLIRIYESARHKNGVRIRMLAGLDALEDTLVKSRNIETISNLLSARQNETAAAVERLKGENESYKYEIYGLKRALEAAEIRNLRPTEGNICVFTESFETDQLRNVCNAGMELCGGICAVFAGSDTGGRRYIMGSKTVDMGADARRINSALGGRGGGRGSMIQGSLTATEAEIRAFFGV